MNAFDNQAMQALSNAGAQCGNCGDEPGDRNCPDCERCYERYVATLRAAGWAPRAEALHEAAEAFRTEFGDVVVRGRDSEWANVAAFIETRARIPQCGDFYPHRTDTRCTLPKGHRGGHRAPWGTRFMAWPRQRPESEKNGGLESERA